MLSRFDVIPERDAQTELLYQHRASICWRAIKSEAIFIGQHLKRPNIGTIYVDSNHQNTLPSFLTYLLYLFDLLTYLFNLSVFNELRLTGSHNMIYRIVPFSMTFNDL